MSTIIRVSVGIITRGAQLLICQRRATDLHPSQWEFPGGKAHDSESDEVCLQRELREELYINATIGEVLERITHSTRMDVLLPSPFCMCQRIRERS